jgi:hypothetical protein
MFELVRAQQTAGNSRWRQITAASVINDLAARADAVPTRVGFLADRRRRWIRELACYVASVYRLAL